MRLLFSGTCVAMLGFALGCAAPSSKTEASAGAATCEVCRYNNDLACLTVAVKDSTPRAEYQGKTYCFCSESCKTAFVKKPEKYVQGH